MPKYVNGPGQNSTVDLSLYDAGTGVLYNAGSGDQTINQDGNYASINLGSGNDLVHLSKAAAYVTFGTGISRVAGGAGHDTYAFSADRISHAGGALDTILYFDTAGDASKDFIQLQGFSAGSTLQIATGAGQQHQTYNVIGADGVDQGSFAVAVNLDRDGTYHQLSAGNYRFEAVANTATPPLPVTDPSTPTDINFEALFDYSYPGTSLTMADRGNFLTGGSQAEGIKFIGTDLTINPEFNNMSVYHNVGAPASLTSANGSPMTADFVDPKTGSAATVDSFAITGSYTDPGADFFPTAPKLQPLQFTYYDARGNLLGTQSRAGSSGTATFTVASATPVASFSIGPAGNADPSVSSFGVSDITYGPVTKLA